MEKDMSIDVIIPLFNGEKFILDALHSVARQTIQPHHIFIIDDGSTDNSATIVQKYIASTNLPITYIRKENGGPNSARNTGIRASSANFLAFLDADDMWQENKLEKQLEIFKKTEYANLGLVYSDYSTINDTGKLTTNKHHTSPKLRGKSFEKLLDANSISGSASAVLIKRSCFDDAGLFDENLKGSEDWDMWLRIAMANYDIDFVAEKLVSIRIHENNNQKDHIKMFSNEIFFINKWINILKDTGRTFLIPQQWSWMIIKRVLRRLPNYDFVVILTKKLSPQAKKILIKKLLWIQK